MIDADYRGPLMVLLYNFSDNDFTGEWEGVDAWFVQSVDKADLYSQAWRSDRTVDFGKDCHCAYCGGGGEFVGASCVVLVA